jgi:hypothetical protein
VISRFRLRVSVRLEYVGVEMNGDAEDAWVSSESGVRTGIRNTSSSANVIDGEASQMGKRATNLYSVYGNLSTRRYNDAIVF